MPDTDAPANPLLASTRNAHKVGEIRAILGPGFLVSDLTSVPGVPEIGKVTAQELLGRFGSLDNVLENLHQLKPKQRQTLQESTSKIAVLRNLIEFRPSFVRVREFPPEFKAAKDLLNSLQMTAAVARVAAIQLAEMKRSDENIPT